MACCCLVRFCFVVWVLMANDSVMGRDLKAGKLTMTCDERFTVDGGNIRPYLTCSV